MMIVTSKSPRVDIESVLDAEQIQAIEHYMHHYPDARAASLDALKIAQKTHGWVNDAQVAAVAQILGISVPDVEGVATFYNRIYRQPVGKHVILMCDSIACYLMGAEDLGAALKKHLKVEFGQTTPDNQFTLLPICCLGNCDKAPTLMIDDDTHSLVDITDVATLLGAYA